MDEGYYWVRHTEAGSSEDRTTFIVLREGEHWYCCGVQNPIDETFSETQIIGKVIRPDH